MGRKDRNFMLALHNARIEADRVARQEQAAIEQRRIEVERDAVAAQREATQALDRVSITVKEYNEMREQLKSLEKDVKEFRRIFSRLKIPYEILESIDKDKVEMKIHYFPDAIKYRMMVMFEIRPVDEVSRVYLENMRKAGC